MKLQIAHQHLRVRIDSDELAELLAGRSVTLRTQFAHAFALRCELSLAAQAPASLTGAADDWRIHLPADQVRDLATRLPAREGLRFELEGAAGAHALSLLFDVDVRDGARRLKIARGVKP